MGTADVKAHATSISDVKRDIEDIELAILKVEQEKANRDHTIKVLQDEFKEQDEVINKLNKEKKHLAECQSKSTEDLDDVNEKVAHLNNVKAQLESTLDQLDSGLDKEKKARSALEKTKRKLEGELKMAQDAVISLERSKGEVEAVIANKENNKKLLEAKLDTEQAGVLRTKKTIKELQARVEAAEEELDAERQARAAAERQRSDLAREMEQLGTRLEEAGGATAAKAAHNKKRESEINKMHADVEEINISNESVLSNLKRKQGNAVAGLMDEILRAQANQEKSNHALVEQLNAINKQVDAAKLDLRDFAMSKNKIANENAELFRIVGDLENNLNILAKSKSALGAQLNDVKALVDNEARERQLLLGKYRNLEHELDGAREALDE